MTGLTSTFRLMPIARLIRHWLMLLVGMGIFSVASAQTLYWDTNGSTAGAGATPTGTWNGTNSNWTTSSTGTTATTTFTNGRDVVFSAGTDAINAFTVTVSGTRSVSSINVQQGTATFTGGTINFSDASPDFIVGSGLTATVNSTISGSNGLDKSGTGQLILAGANTFTGATDIFAGSLRIQSAGALGTAANSGNTTVASGAELQMTGNITTNNTGTLVLNGTGSGLGALQNVSGNNTWNSNISLGSASTVTSSTAGQTLTLGNASATSLFSMGANTLTFDGAGDTWINSNLGVSGDTGGIVKNGTGKLTLYGYNTYTTGATTVNAGSLDLIVGPFNTGIYGLNGALTIGTGPANPGAAGTVSVNIATNSYANQLSPSSNVTINSDGILNVGSSTGLGDLTLNGGQVSITAGKVISPTGNISSNANSANQTSTISGGQVTLAGLTTFTVGRDATLASDLTVSSVIAGGALTKSGLGVLTLSGSNTYTGATTINAGTLSISADTNLGAVPGSPTPGQLTLNGGTLQTTSNLSLSANRGISIGAAGGTLGVSPGTTLTYNGILAGGGTLTKADTGTLVLGGATVNTHTGDVNVVAGTLQIAKTVSNAAFGDNAAVAVSTGATLEFAGNASNTAETFGSLAGGGTLNNSAATAMTLTTGGSNASTTFSGVLQNTGGNLGLVKTGNGTLTLSGTAANTYAGTTAINNGTVALNKTSGVNTLGTGAIAVGDGVGSASSANLVLLASNQIADNAAITINADGRLALGNFTESIGMIAGTGLIDLSTSGYLKVGANNSSSTFGGSLAGTGTLEKAGSGVLTFTSNIAFAGDLTLSGGTLALSNSSLGLNTLLVTANSTIDFGGVSSLNLTNLTISAGVTLTVQNWANASDYFFTQNWTGATFDTTSVAPMNQIVFTGFPASATKWLSYDKQITPVPEPSTYGAVLIGSASLLLAWRRRRRQ